MTDLNQSIVGEPLRPEQRLSALAVSRGIGIGRVVFLHSDKHRHFRIELGPNEVEGELDRLRSAIAETRGQLLKLATDTPSDQPVSDIFGVHLLILEQSSFVQRIEAAISEQRINAEWALKIVTDHYVERQGSTDDEHIREKSLDIKDVANRILSALDGTRPFAPLTYAGSVIAAPELRPSTILELTKVNPAAIITERGGWTSHSSILAREFHLPMISGIKRLEQILSSGASVIVDGMNGELILDPNTETVEHFRAMVSRHTTKTGEGTRPAAVTTADGAEIIIRANIDTPDAYQAGGLRGARGIGLSRSESLIRRSGTVPSEDEQLAAYSQLCQVAGPDGVKIRTFDIGIDQVEDDRSAERNPSLGLRSIRLSLTIPTFFRTQVRAILRAACGNRIDIVLPMITGVEDIIRSRALIDEEREKLEAAGIAVGVPLVGAMIEVPSSVLTAREIAAKVDFLCLGTNDLVQHLLAVDRDNHLVADWYQTLHPAVIRAIAAVLSAAREGGIPVLVCGEMAGSAFYVPLLIGLGARELSMNASSIGQIQDLVSGITLSEAEELVAGIEKLETSEEIERYLRRHYREHWNSLFPPGILDAKHR